MQAGDDISSVRRGLNIGAANSNLKRKASTKNRADIDQNDFEIGKNKDSALEIYE